MMEADEPLVGGQGRNKRKRLVYFGIVAAIIVTAIVLGVGLGLGLKHKKNSEPVPQENLFTYGFNDIFNSSFKPSYYAYSWSQIGGIYFVTQGGNVYQHNVTNDQRTLLLNSSSLPQSLQSYSKYSVSPSGRYMALAYNTQKVWRHSFIANYYIYDTKSNAILGALGGENASIQNLVWSPSETNVAYVYSNNIYLATLNAGLTEVVQVTYDGLVNSILNGILSWVYEEEIFGDFNAIWYSSEGDKLSFIRSDESNVPEFEFAYYDNTPYTDIIKLPYPKPGYPNPIVSLAVYNIIDKSTNFINTTLIGENDYIYSVQWNNDTIYVQYLNRNQTTLNIVKYEGPNNSIESELYSYQTTDRWIDVFPLVFLNNGNAITLKAAENEFNHIFNLNTQTFLTEGDWLVSTINGYNKFSDTLYFTSTEVSSITRHIYSIKSNGSNKVRVTGDNTDDAYYSINLDADSEYYVLSYLGPNVPNQYLYSTSNPKFQVELVNNQNLENLLANYNLPSIEYGTLPIFGTPNMMIRYPPNFDKTKKYSVLMFVYGGPDSQQVTKRFDLSFNSYVASQLGYVVVVVDGRGTGGRGYNYEKYVYLKLGQYETIDQVAAAQYLQENYEWVDVDNVGIWGWSYGGFMTLMSLANGSDTFNFGISVAPVTSWTFYDSTYTERYMLTPQLNPSGYEIGSALTNGPKIKNNALLLIHGTADDNVHFENTAEMAEVLIQNKIQFETQFYTNSDHSINNGNSLIHLYTRMSTFLSQKSNK